MELQSIDVKLWFHYEQIAMHFNQLIIQYRLQLMGGTGAIGAVASYLIATKSDDKHIRPLRTIVSFIILILVAAAAYLDLYYYNLLLEGAVKVLLDFEKAHEQIKMSTVIHEHVKETAGLAIWIWYGAILVPLGVFCVWSLVNWLGHRKSN